MQGSPWEWFVAGVMTKALPSVVISKDVSGVIRSKSMIARSIIRAPFPLEATPKSGQLWPDAAAMLDCRTAASGTE
jgi:hypothetical protein